MRTFNDYRISAGFVYLICEARAVFGRGGGLWGGAETLDVVDAALRVTGCELISVSYFVDIANGVLRGMQDNE